MAKDDPFELRETPLEVGPMDLSAWLPAPVAAAAANVEPGSGEPLPGLAVEVWRLRGRLGRLGELLQAKELRPVEAAVARMEELLRAASVELEDPAGRPFREGEPVEVLLFEPSPGLERPMVLQTVKPGVRVGGRLVRRPEVVVGTPQGQGVPPTEAKS